MKNLFVNKIIPFSNVDGPGNRFAIFLQGCNLNCLYCHNPETIHHCINCGDCIDVCDSKALSFSDKKISYNKKLCTECDKCIHVCHYFSSPKVIEYSTEDVLTEIEKYSHFISGITISGGECTLQHETIERLFGLLKEKYPRLTRFIDTNGFWNYFELSELIPLTDFFIYDVKAFDKNEHESFTGVKNDVILSNLKQLLLKNKIYEVRTVISPGLFDIENTIINVSKLLNNSSVRYKLIRFRPHGVRASFKNLTEPNDEFMINLRNIALAHHDKIVTV